MVQFTYVQHHLCLDMDDLVHAVDDVILWPFTHNIAMYLTPGPSEISSSGSGINRAGLMVVAVMLVMTVELVTFFLS